MGSQNWPVAGKVPPFNHAGVRHQGGGFSLAIRHGAGVTARFLDQVISLDFLYGWLFPVAKPVNVNSIGLHVQSGVANAVARVGIYRATSNKSNVPAEAVFRGGELDCSTGGLKTESVSVKLRAGTYLLAFVNGVAQSTFRTAHHESMLSFGARDGIGDYGVAANRSFAYAALPDPFGPTVGVTVAVGCPVLVRFS